jgi:ABC-type Fe3+-hydroxamate transport system substrate-binding protein
MKKTKYLLSLLIIVLLTTGMVKASEIKRIVSLAPSLTKNIQYLHSEDLLVGCTSYCQPTKETEIVASAVKVNVEKVVTLKPDLVIATTITKEETIQTLRKFGIRVEVYPTAHSFDDICTQFLNLGKLIGREAQATKVINESRQKVEKLKKNVVTENKIKMFIQIGANPLYTVLPNTFMDDYITFSGCQNIASDLSIGTITRENVLLRNPDVIFVVTMGIVGEEEKLNWEKIKELNASQNKKIFIIESDKACTPTPVTFTETLETIINLTYRNDEKGIDSHLYRRR